MIDRNRDQNPLAREALAWLVRLDDEPANDALYAELQLWLQRSPAHQASWNSALDLSSDIQAALPADIDNAYPLDGRISDNVVPLRRRPPLRTLVVQNWRKLGAAAVAACLTLVVAPDLALRFQAQEITGTGEVRTVAFSDGSKAYLAPDSAISFEMDLKGRAVHLLRGRAFFDVARDPGRPFKVAAGEATVTVLGTAFEVDKQEAGASVAVQRGLVVVAYAGRGSRTVLHPGESVSLDWQGSPTREFIHADRVAGWTKGKLFVKNRPIGEVLKSLRPWYSGYIVIRGTGAQTRRVTGIYDLRHPDAALTALSKAHPLSVQQVTPWVRVVTVD